MTLRFAFPILLLAVAARAEPAASSPWDGGLSLDYNAASSALAALHAADPADARVALAHAGTLLARQPRTAANVARARALLAWLLSASPTAPALAPEHRALARYLIARIDHDHLSPPDLDSARAGYTRLRAEHPDHPLSDHAAVQLALLDLASTPALAPATRAERLAALIETTHLPSARRELLQLVARIHWEEFDAPADALPPLLEARRIGFDSPARNGEIDLLIADLAARAGQGELASRHYLAFARAYPRDLRASTARRLAGEAFASASSPDTSPAP
jgi:hypothetical protein